MLSKGLPLSLDLLKTLRFDAFLFDMDGTILDSSAASERVWGAWAKENGIPTPAYHGRRVEDTMADLHAYGIDIDTAAGQIKQRELDDLSGVVALPGAVSFLRALPKDKWTVVTSAPRELALRRMQAAGIPVPGKIVAAEDVTAGKPKPDPFLAGAKLLSVDPARCLVFEDADAGIRAGEAAGAHVLVITHTQSATLTGSGRVKDYMDLSVVEVDGALVIEERHAL